MGKKPSKSTKKFNSKQLNTTLARRKIAQKIKKSQKGKFGPEDEVENQNVDTNVTKGSKAGNKGAEVTFDEFLDGKFNKAIEGDSSEDEFDSDDEHSIGEDLEYDETLDGPQQGSADSEDEDNDDDEEEGATDLKSQISKHKKQLELLKKQDPEFAAHLAANEPGLLNFGDDDEDDEQDESDDEEAEQEKSAAKILTQEALDRLIANATNGLPALKRIVLAFRSLVHLGDDGNEDSISYKVNQGAVFNQLVIFCLKNMDTLFHKFIGKTDGTVDPTKKVAVATTNKWKKLEHVAKSYLSNLLHFTNQLTDAKMIAFVLHQTLRLIPFFAPFPKIARTFLKLCIQLWTTSEDATRVLALLNIRELALGVPYPFIEMCMKHVYLAFVRNSNFTNVRTMPTINFLMNGVAEIYSLDTALAYQHSFVYIRELAVLLRKAIQEKSTDSYQRVYNWQYINALRFFARLVSQNSEQTELSLLVYPLVQIIFGVATLVPSAAYFPLRLTCCQLLMDLSEKSNVFVSPVSLLLEIFDASEIRKKPKSSKMPSKMLDLPHMLKVAKSHLGTKPYQDSVFNGALNALYRFYSIQSASISFPDLIVPTAMHLRKWAKNCTFANQKKQVLAFVEKIELQSQWVLQHRNKLEYSPADTEKVKSFLIEYRTAGADKKTPLTVVYEQIKTKSDAELANLLKDNAKHASGDDEGIDENDMAVVGEEDDSSEVERKEKKSLKNKNKRKAKKGQEQTNTADRPAKKVKPAYQPDGNTDDVVEDFAWSDDEDN